MALSLDKYLLGPSAANKAVREHVDIELDFVGFFNDWSTKNVTACVSSSGWSECVVDAYHMCAWDVPATKAKAKFSPWEYSVCMFGAQTPSLECASANSRPNETCTDKAFPGLVNKVSEACAHKAFPDELVGKDIHACATGPRGAALLEASFNYSRSFYRNPKGTQIEPQWVEVDGPDCRTTGWDGCKGAFDKTHCENWDHCDSDAWAKHVREGVCAKAGIKDCGTPA